MIPISQIGSWYQKTVKQKLKRVFFPTFIKKKYCHKHERSKLNTAYHHDNKLMCYVLGLLFLKKHIVVTRCIFLTLRLEIGQYFFCKLIGRDSSVFLMISVFVCIISLWDIDNAILLYLLMFSCLGRHKSGS